MPSPYHQTYGTVVVTAATVTITADAYLGVPIVLSRAAGVTATLPAATGSGNSYTFYTDVDASGSQIVKVANSSDTMAGVAMMGDGAAFDAYYTADTSDTITLNATTSGGYKGAKIVVTDIKANLWAVEVLTETAGTAITPFSASV